MTENQDNRQAQQPTPQQQVEGLRKLFRPLTEGLRHEMEPATVFSLAPRETSTTQHPE